MRHANNSEAQLAIEMPRQERGLRFENADRLMQDIWFMRKQGFLIYRCGHLVKLDDRLLTVPEFRKLTAIRYREHFRDR